MVSRRRILELFKLGKSEMKRLAARKEDVEDELVGNRVVAEDTEDVSLVSDVHLQQILVEKKTLQNEVDRLSAILADNMQTVVCLGFVLICFILNYIRTASMSFFIL